MFGHPQVHRIWQIKKEIDIRLYRVIYNAIEDIEAAMKGMLELEYKGLF